METSQGIRSHQESHLTPQDFIELDFKKSMFSRISRFCKNRREVVSSMLGFRTWGGLESTLKIIMVDVENSSFEYNLAILIWISEGLGILA